MESTKKPSFGFKAKAGVVGLVNKLGQSGVAVTRVSTEIGALASVPVRAAAPSAPSGLAPAAPSTPSAPSIAAEAPPSIRVPGSSKVVPKKKIVAVVPVPSGAITPAEWRGPKTDEQFATILKGPNPVEIKADKYMPVSAGSFPDFIVQTYQQYSPHLMNLFEEAYAAQDADTTKTDEEKKRDGGVKPYLEIAKSKLLDSAAEIKVDKEKCKARAAGTRELFYYQKFIRDYLSYGSPYRGLLVYHGLGTGKTCASIAAAEALYYGGKKTIYILTPATLSNNYRKDIAKCGFYPLRQNNYWKFLQLNTGKGEPAYIWLTEVLGLPPDYVEKRNGGWVPSPGRATNWGELTQVQRDDIKAQQAKHLEHRFKFIHYNGVSPASLSETVMDGVRRGQRMFDNSVIVIDEVHNLVRTINGTQMGGKPLSVILKDIEPREATWSLRLATTTKGYRYPRAYTLYRLLQNAVGAKVIALSATPMINYAQEMAILMNIIAGEQRMAEIPLPASVDPAKILNWIRARPDIDYSDIETTGGGATVLNITPVPFQFTKVVEGGETRGFVRDPDADTNSETSRERTMDAWAASVVAEMKAAGVVAVDLPPARIITMPLLPEDATEFVETFINKNTLEINNANILKARATGLVSYYRGGSEELMPRVGVHEVVNVPMSEYMFAEYVRVRSEEIRKEPSVVVAPTDNRAFDLYEYATKSKQTGFLSQSRAACNWVFPEGITRPMNEKQHAKLLGIEKEKILAADGADAEPEADAADAEGADEGAEVAVKDEVVAAEPVKLDAPEAATLATIMAELEGSAASYLKEALATYSPKYAEMLRHIQASPGPALVYSQFKRLEGLGIFAAALRTAGYLPLDIQKIGGEWAVPDEQMDIGRPRYILYTGDQDREKRRLLLQMYNADLGELPAKLAEQCRVLLNGADDNRDGRVCRVFMITQSGAEGISLSNTRQVHIMEPYWNNVRLQQVIGRAIRLCSHMNLPWEDRVVDIYTYLSVFSQEQKNNSASNIVLKHDNAMTTDQVIYDIAVKKQQLADELAAVLKSAAVDCQLHYYEHEMGRRRNPVEYGKAVQCFKFSGARPMFMYHPDWHKDSEAIIRAAGGE